MGFQRWLEFLKKPQLEWIKNPMSHNRRIFLNIVTTCGRSLCAGVCGVVAGRWVLVAAEKSEFGVCGVVGGMMVIELLAGTMRPKFRDLLGWSVLFITIVL